MLTPSGPNAGPNGGPADAAPPPVTSDDTFLRFSHDYSLLP